MRERGKIMNALAKRESGSCKNRRIVYLADVERAVLDGMRDQLRDPRLIEVNVRRYNEERQRLAAAANASRATGIKDRRRRARAATDHRSGDYGSDRGEAAYRRTESRTSAFRAAEARKIISLHPAALDRYLATVDSLAVALADHAVAEDDRGSVVRDFRALVHSVTVHPDGPRKGFEVEVKGKLAALIGGEAFPQARYSGGRMVAEERYRLSPHQPNIPYYLRSCG
jgi:site-specific DNA recombinase